ncbi:MAG: hypothetical protein QY332_10515 [Anaerolineales bacterium]|nr:MAG: hypothetical protein QY332_10515 [Anaerolineales bacterium]
MAYVPSAPIPTVPVLFSRIYDPTPGRMPPPVPAVQSLPSQVADPRRTVPVTLYEVVQSALVVH